MTLKGKGPALKATIKSLPALNVQKCMFQIVEDAELPEICSIEKNS
jgi:hypothetical protein